MKKRSLRGVFQADFFDVPIVEVGGGGPGVKRPKLCRVA